MPREDKKYIHIDPDNFSDELVMAPGTYHYRAGVDPLQDPEWRLMRGLKDIISPDNMSEIDYTKSLCKSAFDD